MRSRRRSSERRKEIMMAVAGAALVVLVAGGIGTLLYLKPTPVVRDARGCLESGPGSVTAILMDRTDRFSVVTAAEVRNELMEEIARVPKNGLLEVYEVGPVEQAVLAPKISVCNPGNGDDADPLYSSPELVRKHWQQKYREPLTSLMDEMLKISKAPSSPIMENLASVKVTAFGEGRLNGKDKRLVVVSDLLQHSKRFSLYSSPPDFDVFNRTTAARALDADLQGVRVRVLLVQRAFKGGVNTGRYTEFWVKWLTAQRAAGVEMLRVTGINE